MWRNIRDWVSEFPPGRVPLLLLTLAILTGGAVLVRSTTIHERPIQIWTFTYLAQVEFGDTLADHPLRDQIKIQNLGAAMFDRLALAILTQTELPTLVEVEQSRVGRYLRGDQADIPFVDLTSRIEAEGWLGKVVPARFARYAVDGHIFGIPHDLHPIVLVYRPDVLATLGVTPDEIQTWDDLVAVAQRFHRPGARGTSDWRYGIAFQTTEAWDFLMLLWQRGGDVFDTHGNVIIDNPLAVDTLERYVAFFAADPPVAGTKLTSWAEDYQALAGGQFLFYAAPDWQLAAMQQDARTILAGKVQCMPLPAWESGGRRTSTSGGTAMLIPKGAGDPNTAWQLAKDLYFNRAALIERFKNQSIVPALTTVYDDPAFAAPVPFFQDQQLGLLLTRLAHEVPPVNGSPYLPEASKYLNIAMPDVLDGTLTPEAALQHVAAQIKATIARDDAALRAAQQREH